MYRPFEGSLHIPSSHVVVTKLLYYMDSMYSNRTGIRAIIAP